MLDLYVDVDACPVFRQVHRTAQSHGLDLYVVTRGFVEVTAVPGVHLVLAEDDDKTAKGDDWIATAISVGDICVTGRVTLAARCLSRGAKVLAPSGLVWTSDRLPAPLRGSPDTDDAAMPSEHEPLLFYRQLEATIAEVRSGLRTPPPNPLWGLMSPPRRRRASSPASERSQAPASRMTLSRRLAG